MEHEKEMMVPQVKKIKTKGNIKKTISFKTIVSHTFKEDKEDIDGKEEEAE